MLSVSTSEAEAIARIAWEALKRVPAEPELLRKATFLEAFAERMPITHEPDEVLTGSAAFGRKWQAHLNAEQREQMRFRGNIGHIIVDYGRVLERGVVGLREDISKMPAGDCREAFSRSLEAFGQFIKRHADGASPDIADTCRHLAEGPPRSFREALQLVWLTQVFLHAESGATAISFGRFDQYLWPYLEKDLADGVTTVGDAEHDLEAFWRKCCPGFESQNLVVGGVDASGRCAENPLSMMVLRVTRRLKLWQPSISVRVGPESSDEFWELALRLCADGFGMPSFFNDPVIVSSLQALDLPLADARDYGIVGCYEATPQGNTHGLTVAGGYALPQVLLEFLESELVAGTFDDFLDGFVAFHGCYYARKLAAFQERWDWMRENQASPFESVCLTGCIESGKSAEGGGAAHSLLGVNILGLGTLVDSLQAIRELVFERSQVTLAELTRQLRDDFPDEKLRVQCRNLPGKFGADQASSNALARNLSRHIADAVLSGRLEHGVRPYPAFFWFLQDVNPQLGATPDGRRAGDRLSYGAGPTELCRNAGPTAVLSSARHVAHDRCACGTPMTISLSRADVAGTRGRNRIRALINGYFDQGGFHLHFNIIDADDLRAAIAEPERHQNLTVRISGYSARFTSLDPALQDAIIERTALGM